jgi:hypothetical protein
LRSLTIRKVAIIFSAVLTDWFFDVTLLGGDWDLFLTSRFGGGMRFGYE